MSEEPFGPPGTVYISGGAIPVAAIPVAAIPLAAASRLLQNSRIGLNVARAEVAGQHGKKLSPGRGACRTVFAVSNKRQIRTHPRLGTSSDFVVLCELNTMDQSEK